MENLTSLSELSANPNGVGFNEDLSPMNSSGFDIGFRRKSQNLEVTKFILQHCSILY